MSPARPGPHPVLPTPAVLEAIATRGRRWTAAFADAQISSVHEAVNREILNGNLTDACTLSAQGVRVLADCGRPTDRALIDLRPDHGCRAHDPCWRIECARCRTSQLDHVTAEVLEERVQQVIDAHRCPDPTHRAARGPDRGRPLRQGVATAV